MRQAKRQMDDFEKTREGLRQVPDHRNSRDLDVGAQEEKATALEFEGGEEPREILHGLNNMLVSILLNAQVIEWKLPSYSRIRRNVHEVERSAQRGAVLVNRLKQCVASRKPDDAGDAAAVEELITMRDQTCEYCEQHGAGIAPEAEGVE